MGEKVPVTRLSEGIVIETDIDKINEYLPVLDKFNLELHKENNQLYLLIKQKDSLSNVMCKADNIALNKEMNTNFILSNVILNQKCSFTYKDIVKETENIIGYMDNVLESAIKKTLLRLRDDNLIEQFINQYTVNNEVI